MTPEQIDILLVEGNPAHAEQIRLSFETAASSATLTVVQSLAEARAQITRRPPDVAIIDRLLPDGEWIELLVPDEKRVPFPMVIVISQGDEQVLKEGALEYVVASETALLEMPRTVERLMREWDNIVRRKRAEKALQEYEARLHSIVKSIPDIIYSLDSEGRITFVSDAVKRYGYFPDELIGAHFFELIHPDDREKARYCFNERRTGDRSTRSLEVRLLRRDREPIPSSMDAGVVDESPVLLFNAEGIYASRDSRFQELVGTQGVARDITERKRLEEQLLQSQKIEAVGQLAGGIAHDFNNMLTAILTTCEFLMLTTDSDDPKREDIELIQEAGERASNLTQQILAFSRRQIQNPEVLDLNEVIGEMHKMLRRLIGENIELVRVSGADLDKVKADRTQIEQVVMNLVLNARDAMPQGGKLTIETTAAELDEGDAIPHPSVRPGRYVMLTVSDTGFGMDADTQSQIFEPFFTTKEEGHGTGMGLSTVFGIVEQNGGSIWTHSEVGVGTTFKIYLPKIEEEVEEGEDESSFEELPRGTERILLVEDDYLVRQQVQRMLIRAGYDVLEAQNGNEALEICARLDGQIALLLTDVIMPQMSGKELADRLVEEIPEIKVIFMSGYADETIIHHGMLQPETIFIPKPFSGKTLATTVRQTLDGCDSNTAVPELASCKEKTDSD